MNWIDRHSVNCCKCGALIDERECELTGDEDAPYECSPHCPSEKPLDDYPKRRPVDQLVDSRREAIAASRCIPAPLGCGGPAWTFDDDLSRKEYSISGLCQTCQNTVFGDIGEQIARGFSNPDDE